MRKLAWQISKRKEINELHGEVGHILEASPRATGKVMDLKLTSIFKVWEDCDLGIAKKSGFWKIENQGKTFFVDTNFLSIVSMSSKKHWFLFLERKLIMLEDIF